MLANITTYFVCVHFRDRTCHKEFTKNVTYKFCNKKFQYLDISIYISITIIFRISHNDIY